MFKGAIFDLDGVITDTVPLHFKAWKKMFSEYGIEFSLDDYKEKVDGIPRYNGAKAILTDHRDEEIKKAGDRKQRYFLELIEKENIPVYHSSIDLAKELRSHKIKVAFASSSRNCKKVLKKLEIINLPDVIIDGNDFAKGKPDPEIFQLAADKLNCAHEECVVFEDAVLGVEAAKNGGMVCIGVDRYNKPARLAKADIVVGDLAEVDVKRIEQLFKK